MGNGRRLKEDDPETLIVAAEPMQGELVQGLRSLDDGFIPPIIDLSLLDRKIMVSNRDAIVWTKRLLDEEGIFAGVSSGAIAAIAVRIADELDGGQRRLPDPRRRLEVPLLGRLHEADRRARGHRLHRLVVAAGRPARRPALPRAVARGSRELAATTSRPTSPRPRARTPRCSSARSTTAPATGGAHLVGGEGPSRAARCSGHLGCARRAPRPGHAERRAACATSTPSEVAELFRIERRDASPARGAGAAVARPGRRASSATTRAAPSALLDAAGGRLGGDGGLIARLARFEAYSDPLREEVLPVRQDRRAPRLARGRRPRELGGLRRQRPDAARAALGPGRAGRRRRRCGPPPATALQGGWRAEAGVAPPLLDDLLWELGRERPRPARDRRRRDLREPPRPPGTSGTRRQCQ